MNLRRRSLIGRRVGRARGNLNLMTLTARRYRYLAGGRKLRRARRNEEEEAEENGITRAGEGTRGGRRTGRGVGQ